MGMDLIRIIAVALLTTFAVLILKPQKPEIAAVVTIAGGVVCILMFVDSLAMLLQNVTGIADRTGVSTELFSSLLRIVGIGYLTEFAAGICSDSGNNSMATKVILGGKVMILVLAIPIINNLIEVVMGVMP